MIRDNEINAITVSRFFLTKSELTPKKIQKLVYYAYSWFIALNNQSSKEIEHVLFNEIPEAWIHGPVFPSIYAQYRSFNWNEVPKINEEILFENDDLMSFLEDIWKKFGVFSADELEYMTHQEKPWLEARKNISPSDPSNNKISLETIFDYYNEL